MKKQVKSEPVIGKLQDENAQRDAIHIAVAPVVAGGDLLPGESIGLVNGTAKPVTSPIGIVDPFLKDTVLKGERFLMFLYPNTITSITQISIPKNLFFYT